jgi:hypothetical protein
MKIEYATHLMIRNHLCRFKADNSMEESELYFLQGQMMARLEIKEHEAHYPNDTWVGRLRLKGWQEEQKPIAEWAKGKVQDLYNS